MKKITLLFVLLFGVFACHSQKQENTSQIATQTANLAPHLSDLSSSLKFLSSDQLKGRDLGSDGLAKAADYIKNHFKKYGAKPYLKSSYFDYFEVKGIKTKNVVGYFPGENPDLPPLIIGAHYDHIGIVKAVDTDSIANGANDNASGTATVLSLVKFFSDKKIKRDVIFALFTAEEKGLLGSKHMSQVLYENEIKPYAIFNIEMVGVPMKDKNYLAYITGFHNSNFAENFNKASGEKVLGFLPEAQDMKLFQRSDNYPFYETFKIPAHTICTFDFTNFDYYHHVKDEFKEIDVAHLYHLIQQIQPGLLSIAQSSENILKIKQLE